MAFTPATLPCPRPGTVTLALCVLVAVFEGGDLQAAGVVAPRIVPQFHLAITELKWFLAASNIGLVAGALLGGRLADGWGRKATLLLSVGLFGIFSLATAWAASRSQLIEARFLTGLGIGGALPNLIALTAEAARPEQRRGLVAWMYCGMPLGGGVASLLSLLGATGHSWRTVFYGGGLAPLLLLPLLWFLLPDSAEFRAARRVQPSTPVPVVLFGEGRALASLLLWISFFSALLVLFLLLSWLPSLLVARGLTPADASWVQVAFNLAGAAGVLLAGAVLARAPVAAVAVFLGGSIAGLLLLAAMPATLPASLAAGSLLGTALVGGQGIVYALAPGIYPTAMRGTGVGVAVSAGRLGSVAGPLVAGLVLEGGGSAADIMWYLIPVLAFGLVAALLLVRR